MPFKLTELDYTVPVSCDLDHNNANARRKLYFKLRDQVMKLADEIPIEYERTPRFSRKPQEAHMVHRLVWDLRATLNEEMIPR